MLGNFSFGDYFKREAIHWAWEFLTDKKWLGIAADRLTVSVYQDDEEAAEIGCATSSSRPIASSASAKTTTFGQLARRVRDPTEFAVRAARSSYHPPGATKSVEVWNLVFTQFNRVGAPPNNLRPLPSKNIDTGMGLERIASVMQGVDTNYHIDILRPIVEQGRQRARREIRSRGRCGAPPASHCRSRPRVQLRDS